MWGEHSWNIILKYMVDVREMPSKCLSLTFGRFYNIEFKYQPIKTVELKIWMTARVTSVFVCTCVSPSWSASIFLGGGEKHRLFCFFIIQVVISFLPSDPSYHIHLGDQVFLLFSLSLTHTHTHARAHTYTQWKKNTRKLELGHSNPTRKQTYGIPSCCNVIAFCQFLHKNVIKSSVIKCCDNASN